MDFETVIGLEVHAQMLTDTKIFCNCSTKFGAAPNSHTCPVCLGMPGVLPVLNKKVVEYALKMALATNCEINKSCEFARKNYFYPDLPKGYQISQYAYPLAEHGYVMLETNGEQKKIGITRIHMEEDAGKLLHDEHNPVSYVDLNRTGVPLIEIVSEPDMRSPEEAADYLKRLHEILVYLEICDGNMEEGSFRCDANVSIRPKGQKAFGTRTELKNMNSFRNVQRALEYEIKRQQYLVENGGTVIQETRLWDDAQGATNSMRSKEEAHDYRYFPDPDLVPILVDEAWVEKIRKELPELPLAKRERFIKDYQIPAYDAGVLTADKALALYYEKVVKLCNKPKIASNWLMGDVMRFLNEDKRSVRECPIKAESLADMIRLIEEGAISGKMAKEVVEDMYKTGKSPQNIIKEKGLVQITDRDALVKTASITVGKYPQQRDDYRGGGREKLFGFFVGQVMKETKGKANPQLVNEILKEILDKKDD
ncbi:MAG TPA: Asp-tRNA(Asn)/Glu-tRNA(Gln) amidotransferase subunit GatB [Smithella sp.]|jgi:aspartyl-tRNA(Asn)/glutamyl-tRNA(Gln) amidotransferase subunit B|nr:Asp-tRNA(Asn)/Glu-tRNA(Gln) amidotransferase subunit GatB [Smithella sp.]OQC53203.1 MAG: Aspartyl/glutamyl-tRNA(Asn/Gln) amidotransferase subunit B [Deltaproteobacteria bacterium ADurb.Bin022]HNQ65035.1 Asp-tRNA(Asn)/Glu-tRNA(Gln) amidotransferase subunit GatB [Smithella sp.]HOE32332.1 Asp-tRNA(Asn)/Glu-tRNA(Gln) amidotransferase subunit GatB [Smithella sp.]HOG09091.1 Asp-tRNA(Asn)/Glu-tRNA(Gln) amidotransferase subunit GatB [Smithella sp.]